MIKSKKDLYKFIKKDNEKYMQTGFKMKLVLRFTQFPMLLIKRYLVCLRKQEYYINTANGNKLKGLLGLFYERRKNKLGRQLGIEIEPNCFDMGLTIWHSYGIVINSKARIGKNCVLHGSNCIGNNGISDGVPSIGNNVDIGYGAVIIGDIIIADNVIIGANAVVNKSVLTPGSVVAGVPARLKDDQKR